MKKLLLLYLVIVIAFLTYLYVFYFKGPSTSQVEQEVGLHGQMEEKYVIVNFLVGIDYWKNVLKGFEDAANRLGVSIEFKGSTQYDVQEQIIVLEQVIARKPAGIAISAMNPEALNETIDKAVDAGIPVVMFDADAPNSKAYSFIGTNNYEAGAVAAEAMAELLNEQGEVAILTLPKQLNHIDRTNGFVETLQKKFPNIHVIDVADGKGDQLVSVQQAIEWLKQYPNLSGIFITEANGGIGVADAISNLHVADSVKLIAFDSDKGTLDRIKDGTISATLVQGTWNMGYWSLMQLFHLHNDLLDPLPDWRNTGISPVPTYVDTGITIVTKENVEHFYAK